MVGVDVTSYARSAYLQPLHPRAPHLCALLSMSFVMVAELMQPGYAYDIDGREGGLPPNHFSEYAVPFDIEWLTEFLLMHGPTFTDGNEKSRVQWWDLSSVLA